MMTITSRAMTPAIVVMMIVKELVVVVWIPWAVEGLSNVGFVGLGFGFVGLSIAVMTSEDVS